jgi:putative solute:sodium symporter small subunit
VNFPSVGSAPFGFWMAQQGSIISFVLILLGYKFWMERIELMLAKDKGESK